MVKRVVGILLIVCLLTVSSCATGVPAEEYDAVVKERDQLRLRLSEKAEELEDMTDENKQLKKKNAAPIGNSASFHSVDEDPAVFSDPDSAATVFVCESGSKYHLASCRYAQESARPLSLSDAHNQGYQPCAVCKPDLAE